MAKQPRSTPGFERRNGAGGFAWEGVATKVDPGANPPNRPRDLVNIRVQGGDIRSRPDFLGDGATVPVYPNYLIDTTDVTERPAFTTASVPLAPQDFFMPHWLGEHNAPAGVRLWVSEANTVINGDSNVGYIDTDDVPIFNPVAAIRSQPTPFAVPLEKFQNEIFMGVVGGLLKLRFLQSPEGSSMFGLVDGYSDETVASFPGYACYILTAFNGKLYFVLGGGGIYSFDGLSVSLELGAVGNIGFMVPYKDTLVAGFVGDVNLHIRDATGVWSTATVGGFTCAGNSQAACEYGNVLYIMSGADKIYTWDGTTLALGHTIAATQAEMFRVAGGVAVPASANACVKIAGRLYYCWSDTAVPGAMASLLGYVDQDNEVAKRYIDVGVNKASVYTGASAVCSAMAEYRGRIWMTIWNVTGLVTITAWHSMQFCPYEGWQYDSDAQSPTQAPFGFGPVYAMRSL